MSITQQEIAEKVAAELQKCGWHQYGHRMTTPTEICLEEAVASVITQESGYSTGWSVIPDVLPMLPQAFRDFWEALRQVTFEALMEKLGDDGIGKVIYSAFDPFEFNDETSVTAEDVILAVKKAGTWHE